MITIRQRKDKLLASIQEQITLRKNATKAPEKLIQEPQKSPHYEEYKKILWSNGIKNEKLISVQLTRLLEGNLPKTAIYSNLKFMHLFRSRLAEEGIPLHHAENIMENVRFNLAEVNEDDDYIGDVALHYAELCKIVYDSFFIACNLLDLPEDIAKQFDIIPVQLPATL